MSEPNAHELSNELVDCATKYMERHGIEDMTPDVGELILTAMTAALATSVCSLWSPEGDALAVVIFQQTLSKLRELELRTPRVQQGPAS